jgi:hypothetical protein
MTTRITILCRNVSDRKFSLGLFWAVGATERKQIQSAISMLLEGSFFYVFIGKKEYFFLNTLASTLKSYIL